MPTAKKPAAKTTAAADNTPVEPVSNRRPRLVKLVNLRPADPMEPEFNIELSGTIGALRADVDSILRGYERLRDELVSADARLKAAQQVKRQAVDRIEKFQEQVEPTLLEYVKRNAKRGTKYVDHDCIDRPDVVFRLAMRDYQRVDVTDDSAVLKHFLKGVAKTATKAGPFNLIPAQWQLDKRVLNTLATAEDAKAIPGVKVSEVTGLSITER